MRILFFSDCEMPVSSANSVRVMNLAKIVISLGHEVTILGVAYSDHAELVGEYESIPFTQLRAPKYVGVKAYKRIAYIQRGIDQFLESNVFDAIVLSNVYFDYTSSFTKYAKKYKAKLIINSVEWYERDNQRFSGPFGWINLLKNRIALKVFHLHMGNILAISSLLKDYYSVRGCNTVLIPTLIDMDQYKNLSHNNSEKIRIAYAGNPARKDYILNVFEAIML